MIIKFGDENSETVIDMDAVDACQHGKEKSAWSNESSYFVIFWISGQKHKITCDKKGYDILMVDVNKWIEDKRIKL
ncbi:MAG: hypothetical protein FWD87_10890 [Spirochaetaceae bacterium]|nr:hypothetical protein [Spirochaetaceae bacterium]